MSMNRRDFLRLRLAPLALAVGGLPVGAATPRIPVQVWKSEGCGCCKDWVKHLEANGFSVQVHDSGNTDARERLGIPLALASCHTGHVNGYALEGHVPAREIHRLLKERPKAVGLAVPGMPLGSPGMDGPETGGRRQPYDVLLVAHGGGSRVYRHYD
jgi:hypothetical protein